MEHVVAEAASQYNNLNPEQMEAVVHFLQGEDVFISLPTGAGKSLCYVVLPFVFIFIYIYLLYLLAVVFHTDTKSTQHPCLF